jgi:hypothetical protein
MGIVGLVILVIGCSFGLSFSVGAPCEAWKYSWGENLSLMFQRQILYEDDKMVPINPKILSKVPN